MSRAADKIKQERRREFLWGDNYWIEDEGAWFVSFKSDILFFVDKKRSLITPISQVPVKPGLSYRLHPRCIKYCKKIFCIPDRGEDIYRYELEEKTWKRIEINNPDCSRIGMYDFWRVGNLLYIISNGLKKVIVLNMEEDEVVEDYYITLDHHVEKITKSIMVGSYIYTISSVGPRVYKFDCETKTVTKFVIPEINGGLQTISSDGENLWLSGYSKKLYIWNEASNKIKILDDFPIEFGSYDFYGEQDELLDCKIEQYTSPTFISSVDAGNYMWFIPFRTNKILYVDKKSMTINSYYLDDEIRSKEDIDTGLLDHMYLFEYLSNSRYLGLLSLKTGNLVEIDCLKLCDRIVKYNPDKYCDDIILNNILFETNFIYENDKIILDDLISLIIGSKENQECTGTFGLGKVIYNDIRNDRH